MDLLQFTLTFDNEEKCIKHLASVCWPCGPVCDRCGSVVDRGAWKSRYIAHVAGIAETVGLFSV